MKHLKYLLLLLTLSSFSAQAYLTPILTPPVSFSSVTGTATPAQVTPATTSVSGTSIDWSLGFVFSKTISVSTTFTFANTRDGQTIIMAVTAGSGNTVTWPSVKWSGGVAPVQTSGGTDVYTFVKIGSVIYGSVIQAMS